MDFKTLIIIAGTLFYVLTCWALLDVARKDFGGVEKKALWGFVSLIPFIGFMIYFIFGFKKGKKKSEEG